MTSDLFLHIYSFRFRLTLDPDWGILDFLDRAVADGFRGVGINVNGPRYRFLGGDEPAHVARIAERLRDLGLDVDIETSSTAPGHLANLLELAERLGARHLRTYTRHEGSRSEVLRRSVADLRAAAPLAARAGIPILLENHEEFTGHDVAHILAAVDNPHVAALYDYGNSMMVREDPLAALAAMLPWTRSAHLKDHVLLAGADREPLVAGVPFGDGVLPIAETTRRLRAAGVKRIYLENVWAYTAPLRPRLDGKPPLEIGNGVLTPVAEPLPPTTFLPDVHAVARRDPAAVIALEEAAYTRSLAFARRVL